MGEYKALISLISLVVYFFVLGVSITMVGDDDINQYVNTDFNSSGNCTAPRYYFNIDQEEVETTKYNKRCIRTRGSYDEVACNSIPGCEFQNATTAWFGLVDVEARCEGTINQSALTNTSISIFTFYNICEFENLQDDPDLCYNIGCTWVDGSSDYLEVKNSGTFLKETAKLFTLRYDFGVSGIWGNIINFALFYIPLFLLIGSIYFLLPFAH